MPLRVRIVDKQINADNTLRVAYQIAWADANGVEVWREDRETVYQGDVTRAQVLSELRQIAEARAGAVRASLALDSDVNKTYEQQSDGTWKAV